MEKKTIYRVHSLVSDVRMVNDFDSREVAEYFMEYVKDYGLHKGVYLEVIE